MNRTSIYNLLSVIIPLVCLAGVVAALVILKSRANAAEEQNRQAVQQIAVVENRIKELETVERQPLESSVAASPMEETGFLNLIRGYAGVGVTIDKFNIATPLAPQGASGEAAAPARPAGVSAVSGSMDVSGPYNAVRQFLYNLHRSSRLFTLRDVKWRRGDKPGTTSASFTLTRYVHSPTQSSTSPAAAAVNAGRQ